MKKFRPLLIIIVATTALLAACETGIIDNAVPTHEFNEPEYSVTASPTELTFTSEGGTASIDLQLSHNLTWESSTSESWITVSTANTRPTVGTGSTSLSVSVYPNYESETRTGRITFTAREKSVSVTVTQMGAEEKHFIVSPDSLSFSANGENKSITVTSNLEWTATTPDTWIFISATSGTGDISITVIPDENTSTESRKGSIVFTAGENHAVITVTQDAAEPQPYFTLSATSISYPASGGSGGDIAITTNLSWTATIDVSWITLSATSGAGSATLTITAAENTSTEIRTATITFEAGDNTYQIAVTQEAAEQQQYDEIDGHYYVDLGLPSGLLWATMNVGATSPEEYGDYYAWGETTTKNKYDWSTYKWCNGSETSFTKYNTNSSYGVVDNIAILDYADDAASINWGGGWRMPTDAEWEELKNNCTLDWMTQNGVYGCMVSGSNKNSIFLPAGGIRLNLDIYQAGSYGSYWSSSLNVVYPNRTWGLGFDSGYVNRGNNVNRNTGNSVRPVYQPNPFLEVSKENLSFTSDGGTDNVMLTTNLEWTSTASDSWITLSSTSGKGNAGVTVTVEGNTATTNRTGSVTFTSGSYSSTVTITQEAAAISLSADVETLCFACDGGTGQVTITTNGNWTATAKPTSYFSVTPTSGSGPATLTVTAKENTAQKSRQGALSIACGNETLSITLIQDGQPYVDTHTYVDLGLPSGTLWATCNVGAEEPHEYGDYFAWGETTIKNNFSWSTYKWCNGSYSTLTKYNFSSTYGTVDKKATLDSSDDAATSNWGENWRTPTDAEWEELRNTSYCTWTWFNLEGVNGYMVTSRTTKKYIFLPAAGDREGTGTYMTGTNGIYWSSSVDESESYVARGTGFEASSVSRSGSGRCSGHSVRPVRMP